MWKTPLTTVESPWKTGSVLLPAAACPAGKGAAAPSGAAARGRGHSRGLAAGRRGRGRGLPPENTGSAGRCPAPEVAGAVFVDSGGRLPKQVMPSGPEGIRRLSPAPSRSNAKQDQTAPYPVSRSVGLHSGKGPGISGEDSPLLNCVFPLPRLYTPGEGKDRFPALSCRLYPPLKAF